MLVNFSVSNYKSFKDKQTLSLVAKKGSEHAFDTGVPVVPSLLNRVVIVGPNASGKSNLLKALDNMGDIIIESHSAKIDEEIPNIHPYLLKKGLDKKPSEFEIVFIINGNLYQYGFATTKTEIIEEWLFVTQKGNKTVDTWFIRKEDNKKDKWEANKKFIPDFDKSWFKETRKNSLFLSVAATLKNQKELSEIVKYLSKDMRVLDSPEFLSDSYTCKQFSNDNYNKRILNFMDSADVGINGMIINKREDKELDPKFMKFLKENNLNHDFFTKKSMHKSEDGKIITLDFDNTASDGTKVLFALAGPLCDVLDNGKVLFIDEMNKSLHYKELEYIESLFTDKNINRKNAQLVYTTHDTTVWETHSREELYIIERKNGFSSELYSVLEKENRNDKISLRRRYEKGSYGGLPNIGDVYVSKK
ncbi:MAG: ATP-binding protein [Alphaproteobacteria bacterium]|nr:ATP-binding protein [Alphaproteobacteria bacterium]